MNNLKIKAIKTTEMSVDDLLLFEEKSGYELPFDYKNFLLKYKGEIFLNTNYLLVDFFDKKDKIAIFRLDTLHSLLKSWNYLKDYNELEGIVPIADTLGGGQFWGLGLNKNNYNKIYLVNPDFSKIEVANSFTNFISKIIFV